MTGTVVRVARHRALGRLRDCVGSCREGEDDMTDTRCPAPIGFADVVDYWAGDLTRPRRTGSKSTCSPAPTARGSSPRPKRWLAVSPPWP